MKEYTADQKARVNAAFKEATRGARRPRLNKYEKAVRALGDVADEFIGSDRDAISRVIDILDERAGES